MSQILKANNLIKHYDKKAAVNDVSLSLERGKITGLLGPNGAGKTSIFYMIVGLLKPGSGKICLDNKNITRYALHQRAKLGIGYLPQEVSIFRKLTTKENILAILELKKSLSKKERLEKCDSLLEEFGLTRLADVESIKLSGGEKRRLEIARTLAIMPSFILLDEPFAGVDPISITEIKNIISQLAKKNIGILITDHNVRETLSLCDNAYIINHGKIIFQGDSMAALSHQEVRSTYLGEQFKL